jgi:hypothetical protein
MNKSSSCLRIETRPWEETETCDQQEHLKLDMVENALSIVSFKALVTNRFDCDFLTHAFTLVCFHQH